VVLVGGLEDLLDFMARFLSVALKRLHLRESRKKGFKLRLSACMPVYAIVMIELQINW